MSRPRRRWAAPLRPTAPADGTSRPSAGHDRTIGIPDRTLTMWPEHSPVPDHRTAHPDRVEEITAQYRDLIRQAHPPRTPLRRLTDALETISQRLVDHSEPVTEVLSGAAQAHHVDLLELTVLAYSVGDLIANVTGLPVDPARGLTGLTALAGANVRLALETHLAHDGLDHLAVHSPPDLPRLWILANGLTHAVPAATLLTTPATSRGSLARARPTHDDLVDWHGAADAIDHLEAIVVAAQTGHAWLQHTVPHTHEQVGRAIGVVHLTDPALARELARLGPTTLSASSLRAATRNMPIPDTIADLTDQTLKAACDRAGWLLGSPDEHPQTAIVHRALHDAFDDTTRHRLADHDLAALTDLITAQGPDDTYLRAAADDSGPAMSDPIHDYLSAASLYAIEHFTGHHIPDPHSRAEAIAARFPDPTLTRQLTLTAADLAPLASDNGPDPPAADRFTDLNPRYDRPVMDSEPPLDDLEFGL